MASHQVCQGVSHDKPGDLTPHDRELAQPVPSCNRLATASGKTQTHTRNARTLGLLVQSPILLFHTPIGDGGRPGGIGPSDQLS